MEQNFNILSSIACTQYDNEFEDMSSLLLYNEDEKEIIEQYFP